MPDITPLDALTKDSFEPSRGERFQLSTPDGPAFDLTLAAIAGNGMRGKAREQFSLHFLGPRDPVLPQMIYRLENPRMGVLEIFLVPIARTDAGVTYEAIFT